MFLLSLGVMSWCSFLMKDPWLQVRVLYLGRVGSFQNGASPVVPAGNVVASIRSRHEGAECPSTDLPGVALCHKCHQVTQSKHSKSVWEQELIPPKVETPVTDNSDLVLL